MGEKQKGSRMMRLAVRGLTGILTVYGINLFLGGQGVAVAVGLNAITFLTSAVLGFPGVALLYGILFYQIL